MTSEGAMILTMATTNKAIQEQIEVLVEVQTCDRCGAVETPQNPIELRHVGAYGYAAFEDGPPEYWMECAVCVSEDEVPY